jgi:hypothetical protein
MKVLIQRVSGEPLGDYCKTLQKYNVALSDIWIDGGMEQQCGHIEISTIEELFQLSNELGYELIITGLVNSPMCDCIGEFGEPTIIIHDSYMY